MNKYRIVRGFVSRHSTERYWIEEKVLWWWRRVCHIDGDVMTFCSQQSAEDKIKQWREADELERRGPVVVSEDP